MRIDMFQLFLQLIFGVVFGSFIAIVLMITAVITPSLTQKQLIIKYSRFLSDKCKIPLRQNWFRKKNILIKISRAILDIAVCIVSAVMISIFAYATNDGVLRWFSLITIFVSLWITKKCLFVPIITIFVSCKMVLQVQIKIIVKLLSYPLMWAYKLYAICLSPHLLKLKGLVIKMIRKQQAKYYKKQFNIKLSKFKKQIYKDVISWQKQRGSSA